MEQVLDGYKRPYDPKLPVVCMDETPRQLIKETRTPIPGARGRLERHDYVYRVHGERTTGRQKVRQGDRAEDQVRLAAFMKDLAGHYKRAKRITLVMDNLSTHKPGSLYETFPPEEARRLRDRFAFVYTPIHGSWLNMAEIELNVMIRQCLSQRIDSLDKVTTAIAAWQRHRDNLKASIRWQFTTRDAR